MDKIEFMKGMRAVSAYFEKNIQTHELFRRNFETSQAINVILESKETLTEPDVTEIFGLLNDIYKVDHYDSSGWYDYQIRLSYYLKLNGFETDFEGTKLYLK